MQPNQRWCFQCNKKLDDLAEKCSECAAPASFVEPVPPHLVGNEDEEQLAYDFHEWHLLARSALHNELNAREITHGWQRATLIIRELDEHAVDEVVEKIDAEWLPGLDPDEETTVYELGELSELQRTRLLRRVDKTGLTHALNSDGDLVAYAKDEEAVDAIYATLNTEDIDEREFGPGIDASPMSVMSDLFVAVSRVRKKPSDSKGLVALAEANQLVRQMKLPYGIEKQQWANVVDRSQALVEASDPASSASESEVIEQGDELYAILRQMV